MQDNSKQLLRSIIIATLSGLVVVIFSGVFILPKMDIDKLITRKSIGIKVLYAPNRINVSSTKHTNQTVNSTNESRTGLFIWIVKNERDKSIQNINFDDKNANLIRNIFTSSNKDPFAKKIESITKHSSILSRDSFQLHNINLSGETTNVLVIEKEAHSDRELGALINQIELILRGNRFDYPIVWGDNRTPITSLHMLTDMELHKSHLFPIVLTFIGTVILCAFINSLPNFSKNVSSNIVYTLEGHVS